jgi:hypothetical protein
MLERRVRDFRLDSRLTKYCQKDMLQLCGAMDEFGLDDMDMRLCLQV